MGKYKLKCFKTITYFQTLLFINSLNDSQNAVKKVFTIFEQKKCYSQKHTDKIELTLLIQTTIISELNKLNNA